MVRLLEKAQSVHRLNSQAWTLQKKVVDVIFSYTNRTTDVTEKFFTRIDVTEELPFLVTKMSPYDNR